jgi:hypothetical protein
MIRSHGAHELARFQLLPDKWEIEIMCEEDS